MSKKLAVGAKYILIDIKVGDGALIKNKSDARLLADYMIKIGEAYDREVIPVLTDMNCPLGDYIGNALEVIEALDVLKGKYGHLRDLCIDLSSILHSKVSNKEIEIARKEVENIIDTGVAYKKFLEFVKNQGGDLENLKTSDIVKTIKSDREGILNDISASRIGYLSNALGAGRNKKNGAIDYGVGIVINKHIGDKIKKGDILCYLYQSDEKDHTEEALNAFSIVK